MKANILISGVAGASLGMEIYKSLAKTGKYNLFAADISNLAYGLYESGFKKTFYINEVNYINNIIKICKQCNINAIIPGAEKTTQLLINHEKLFTEQNILIAGNSKKVVDICMDKAKLFNYLKKNKIPIPRTKNISSKKDLKEINYPSIIKPSKNSGGSSFVYIVNNKDEAFIYLKYLSKYNIDIIAQEYIRENVGEFTIGILSLNNQKILKSVALKRIFNSKLSYLFKTQDNIISTGYSQGLIDDFAEIRKQAEKIAILLESTGPLNVQGRVKNGILYPFEINPRFSASTYLRTLAGFNEVDIYLQYLLNKKITNNIRIKPGFYLRSLTENYISKSSIK